MLAGDRLAYLYPKNKYKGDETLFSVISIRSMTNNDLIQNEPSKGIKCSLFERLIEKDSSAIIHNSQSRQDNSFFRAESVLRRAFSHV